MSDRNLVLKWFDYDWNDTAVYIAARDIDFSFPSILPDSEPLGARRPIGKKGRAIRKRKNKIAAVSRRANR